MKQLATLRMETLLAAHSAITDDVWDGGESQRTGTDTARAWQRKASAEIPRAVPCTTFRSPGAGEKIRELDWNPSDGIAPEIDPVVSLSDEDLQVVFGGVKDAEPSVLSFFNGKPYSEGLKAYNEHLASKGAGRA
jgi:hypothetical protein